jgi:hypothetical protein
MKLLRYGAAGQERPGLLDEDGRVRDLGEVVDDIAGQTLTMVGLGEIRALQPASLPLVVGDERLGPALGRIGKFICVGQRFVRTGIPA